MSSDYFVPEVFMAENQNNGLRKRERKRGAYKLFLEYLESLGEKVLMARTYVFEDRELAKQTALEHALHEANQFNEDHKAMMVNTERMKVFKENFNGNLVTELTGLTGGDLGKFMKFVQGDDKEKFLNFVVYNHKNKVREYLLNKFNEFEQLN